MASSLPNVLTQSHLNRLASAEKECEEALALIRAAQSCEVDCQSWEEVAHTLLRKIRLLKANFGGQP